MVIAKKTIKKSGFTLIELMVTILIASVAFIAVGMVISDGIRGYKGMFTRIHGNIVNDAYVARIKFDRLCRMARTGTAVVFNDSQSLTINYYSAPNVSGAADLGPDNFATFYLTAEDDGTNTLTLDTGTVATGTIDSTETIARTVDADTLRFSETGTKSVQMVLTLDDSEHSITITCGSIMHN